MFGVGVYEHGTSTLGNICPHLTDAFQQRDPSDLWKLSTDYGIFFKMRPEQMNFILGLITYSLNGIA